jgi:hypothetical protein
MRFDVRAPPTSAMLLLALLPLASCACRVPGREKAEGGKYRKCARTGRGGEGEVTAGGVTCRWDGDVARCTGDTGESLDLCVLAGDASSAWSRRNLDAFIDTCTAGGVDMMVALGDVAEGGEGIVEVAGALDAAGVPVGMLPGSREHYKRYMDALDAAREEGLAVMDLSRVRTVRWGEAALVSLPGIRRPHYLAHPGEGCGYDDGDVDRLGELVEEAGGDATVVVLSVQPPACSGPWGVDVSRSGVHVGDTLLRETLLDTGGLIGVFGHVHEAGGVVVDPESCGRRGVGVGHEALWINAGSIEGVAWEGEGGGVFSTGQGVVLQVADGMARTFIWSRELVAGDDG